MLVSKCIEANPHSTIREMELELDIPYTTIQRILTGKLDLHNVASYWVPRNLTAVQKQTRMVMAKEMLERLERMGNDRYNLYAVEDETWVRFDVEHTQRSSRVWIPKNAERPQVPSNRLTPRKCMLLIAFTPNKRISVSALPYGENVDGDLYMDFVRRTGDKWRTLRSNPVTLNCLVWQHDNARPHTKNEVKSFFQGRGVELLSQPPYSPDLNLCDRWLNDHIKTILRQQQFETPEEVENEVVTIMRNIPEEKYHREVDQLMKHCQRVICEGGGYVTPSYS